MIGMARLLAVLFMIAAVTISCAAYTPQPATLLRIQSAAFSSKQEDFAIGVSPHLDPARNEDVFQADLRQAGILPLQIVMRNSGSQRLAVRKEDFTLQLADDRQLSPAPADLVASRLESKVGVAGWTIAFGLLGYLASSAQQEEADVARRVDLRQKEIQDHVLPAEESSTGFIFFLVPPDVTEIAAATLVAKATVQASGREIRASVFLKELGTWNRPNRIDREPDP